MDIEVSKTNYHRHLHGTHTMAAVLRLEGFDLTLDGPPGVVKGGDLIPLNQVKLSTRKRQYVRKIKEEPVEEITVLDEVRKKAVGG